MEGDGKWRERERGMMQITKEKERKEGRKPFVVGNSSVLRGRMVE